MKLNRSVQRERSSPTGRRDIRKATRSKILYNPRCCIRLLADPLISSGHVFQNLEGVDSFIDDVLIWGATIEEHDRLLLQVLD